MEARWKINGTDITAEYGVLLRKGAYDAIMTPPPAKAYVTESCREDDGEKAYVSNPRSEARDVVVPCVIYAEGGVDDLWNRRDAFLSLLKSGELEMELCLHDRTFRYYYKTAGNWSRISRANGTVYCTFSLTLREPNPDVRLSKDHLAAESSDRIITEDGNRIIVMTSI